jgi:hypothetical protein
MTKQRKVIHQELKLPSTEEFRALNPSPTAEVLYEIKLKKAQDAVDRLPEVLNRRQRRRIEKAVFKRGWCLGCVLRDHKRHDPHHIIPKDVDEEQLKAAMILRALTSGEE